MLRDNYAQEIYIYVRVKNTTELFSWMIRYKPISLKIINLQDISPSARKVESVGRMCTTRGRIGHFDHEFIVTFLSNIQDGPDIFICPAGYT